MKAKHVLLTTGATLFLASPLLSSYTMAADEVVSPLRGSDKGNCQSVHAVIGKQVVMDWPIGPA
jgi:hypothetical protein